MFIDNVILILLPVCITQIYTKYKGIGIEVLVLIKWYLAYAIYLSPGKSINCFQLNLLRRAFHLKITFFSYVTCLWVKDIYEEDIFFFFYVNA